MRHQYNIGVIGAGAIGSMVAYYLNRAGFPLAFVGRDGPIATTLNICLGNTHQQLTFPAMDVEAFDLCFVTVKSTQLAAAIQQHSFLSKVQTIIICNGLVDHLIPPTSARDQQWRLGSTTIGVSKDDDCYRIYNNDGAVLWGGPHPSKLEIHIANELREYGFRFSETSTYFRQKKWLFNVVINSLAGYYQLENNGHLLKIPAELLKCFNEAFALGEELFGGFGVPQAQLFQQMSDLIEATKENENSMVRDIRLGRETEHPFLLGLIEKSQQSLPHLRKLHHKLGTK